ncbi:unnamed protein product [Pleuronectes platessa]|uniref:Uncharacterized protein n=1 Tax=Pleuronectes platessa TaxID=8262 RepID=A0A9N7TYC6_PLEPL|nr:unnamed protein product [Pleuronectes platessa]
MSESSSAAAKQERSSFSPSANPLPNSTSSPVHAPAARPASRMEDEPARLPAHLQLTSSSYSAVRYRHYGAENTEVLGGKVAEEEEGRGVRSKILTCFSSNNVIPNTLRKESPNVLELASAI